MNKKTLFTTSIYEKLNFINENDITNLISYIKDNKVNKTNNNFNGDVDSSFSPEPKGLLDNFLDLKNNLNKEIKKCADMIGCDSNLEITNSWYNVQKRNSTLKMHTHANSIISGILYLKVDKNSSRLYFSNPNPILKTLHYNEYNSDNYDRYAIVPENGLLLMWPSWMLHGSDTDINNSDERIVISFNTYYKR